MTVGVNRFVIRAALVVGILATAVPAMAGPAQENRKLAKDSGAAEQRDEMVDSANQFAAPRIAPGTGVSSQAFTDARTSAGTMPVAPASWTELTTQRYWSDDP